MTTKERMTLLRTSREIYQSVVIAITNEGLTPVQNNYELLFNERRFLLQMVDMLDSWATAHVEERRGKL